jgi:hypothetical protein
MESTEDHQRTTTFGNFSENINDTHEMGSLGKRVNRSDGGRQFNYNPENKRIGEGRDPKELERFFKDAPACQTVHQEIAEDEEYLVSRFYKKPVNDTLQVEETYLDKIEGDQVEERASVIFEDENPINSSDLNVQEEVKLEERPLKEEENFYHCKPVTEEDPNFLLKALTLQPHKAYVPTFLRV